MGGSIVRASEVSLPRLYQSPKQKCKTKVRNKSLRYLLLTISNGYRE